MTKILALVRERNWEDARWIDYFTIDEDQNPEQSLRTAVREFLLTKDGTEAIKASSEDFNWGDAVMHVPDETLKRHGIAPLTEGQIVIFSEPIIVEVVQDEILIPSEYYDGDEE